MLYLLEYIHLNTADVPDSIYHDTNSIMSSLIPTINIYVGNPS